MVEYQANTECFPSDDPRTFEVGRALRFVAYLEDGVDNEAGRQFRAGDTLRPVPRNACGMGVDVRRDSDGHTDMIWSDEVEVIDA